MKIKVKNDEKSKPTCQFCLSPDLTGKPVIICERCGAITHEQCIKENNGCPTPGCAKSMKMPAKMPPSPVPAAQAEVPTYRPRLKERWSDFELHHRAAADFFRHLLISTIVGIMCVVVVGTVRWAYIYGGVVIARWCIIGFISIAVSGYYVHDRIKRERG